MHFVLNAVHVRNYMIRVTFEDSSVKLVDLEKYLSGELFEPLKDTHYFARFKADLDLDTIVWENGADFSPDFLYEIGATLA